MATTSLALNISIFGEDSNMNQKGKIMDTGKIWQSPFTQKSMVKPRMGEVTPFVFKDRLYLLENYYKFFDLSQGEPGQKIEEDRARIWDVEADKEISSAIVGHGFASAFVWEDKVYVFAGMQRANTPWRKITEIAVTSSSDLVHWTQPKVIIRAEKGEHVFNTAICRGKDKFVLLYETDDRRWPAFTFKYLVSDNLLDWTYVPDAIYGREKYVGGPALYYENECYYTLYLQDLGGKWETRITRSKDLRHWQDALTERPFITYDSKRSMSYWEKGQLKTVKEINASDVELCYWKGKTLVYFNGGDQQNSGDLQLAEFDGTPQKLFEKFYE